MVLPQLNTGIFVGLNKGHIVTNREFSPPDLPAEKVYECEIPENGFLFNSLVGNWGNIYLFSILEDGMIVCTQEIDFMIRSNDYF